MSRNSRKAVLTVLFQHDPGSGQRVSDGHDHTPGGYGLCFFKARAMLSFLDYFWSLDSTNAHLLFTSAAAHPLSNRSAITGCSLVKTQLLSTYHQYKLCKYQPLPSLNHTIIQGEVSEDSRVDRRRPVVYLSLG